MYARRVGNRELTFDFAEGLINDNLLVVDRETSSVWSQLHGQAVIGELTGTPLQPVPSLQSTWKFWRAQHPDTQVVTVPDHDGVPYFYSRSGSVMGRVHDTTQVGLGLVLNDAAVFFPFGELSRMDRTVQTSVGGESVRVTYDDDGLTAWANDRRGELLTTVIAYRKGWLEFYPDSEIYRAP